MSKGKNVFETLCRKTIDSLLGDADETRLSLYLPTHRFGPEAEADRATLQICLKEAEEQLAAAGWSEDAADAFLKPARKRLGDDELWRHLGEGLAVLLAPGRQHWIRAEVPFARRVTLGSRFRLAPLVLALQHAENFFVLALSLNEVRLLDVGPDGVRRLRPEGLPESFDDALGFDEFDTGLHVHSAGPRGMGRQPAVVHGHGGNDEERRRSGDFRAYARRVADVVRRTAGTAPLVLASVEEHFPIFREVYGSEGLVTGIRGNPDSLADAELAEAARELLAGREVEQIAKRLHRYRELPDRQRVSESPSSIVAAATVGRVDTLFVERNRDLWGTFEPELGRAEIHGEREPGDGDLLDLAVTETLLHGGDVVAVPSPEMPGPGPLAALLRFRSRKVA